MTTSALTFLFTDIEGSTALWEQRPHEMALALANHNSLLRRSVESCCGQIVKNTGDGVLASFGTGRDALAAAIDIQRALQSERQLGLTSVPIDASPRVALKVRIGLHTGNADFRDGEYIGPTLNRAARVMAAAHGDQILVSSTTADLVCIDLPENTTLRDLGDYQLRGLLNPIKLYQVVAPGIVHDDRVPLIANVPVAGPILYGRDSDIEVILRLVAQERLVSIIGPAGIGKTRLVQAIAHRMRPTSKDGVWVIELGALRDLAQLVGAVAQALKVPVSQGIGELDVLADAVHGRSLTLVLDNCEHLLDAVGRSAVAIRRAAPGATILTTSQEALRIPGECVYRLGALAVPRPDVLPNRQEALGYGAVALLVARSSAADPRFQLNERNLPAVLDICRRLDGIPLALEFAAARVPLLGMEGVRSRLDERFKLLTVGERTALPRHQTLRAALEWSYALLSDAERIVFRRLSVFVGDFALHRAQAVAQDANLRDWEVLDALGGLVDKSMVAVDATDPPRFRLLETSRAYALERLQEADETESLMRCHGRAFRDLFESSWAERWSQTPDELFARYRPDLENLRAAIAWSSTNDHEQEIALTGAAAWLWFESGLNAEGVSRHANVPWSTSAREHPQAWKLACCMSWPALGNACFLSILQTER